MVFVEVRYLNGDSISLENCESVGEVMVRIANIHERFATDVSVIITETGTVLDDVFAAPPPKVSVVLLPRDILKLDNDVLRANLRLHAAHEDIDACKHLMEILRVRNPMPYFDLEWVIGEDILTLSGRMDIMIPTLLRVGVPIQDAMISISSAGQVDAVKALISAGGSVNHANSDGTSGLMRAASHGHTEVVHVLLSAGAIVNHTDEDGTSALLLAARSGHTSVVKALIDAGAGVTCTNKYGWSALTLAASDGRVKTVEALVEKRDSHTSGRASALILAARFGHVDTVSALLAAGADVEYSNFAGASALVLASRSGHRDVVEHLLAANADVNHTNREESSALIEAARFGHPEVVGVLVAAGARVEHTNSAGSSAIVEATRFGHTEVVELLLGV